VQLEQRHVVNAILVAWMFSPAHLDDTAIDIGPLDVENLAPEHRRCQGEPHQIAKRDM